MVQSSDLQQKVQPSDFKALLDVSSALWGHKLALPQSSLWLIRLPAQSTENYSPMASPVPSPNCPNTSGCQVLTVLPHQHLWVMRLVKNYLPRSVRFFLNSQFPSIWPTCDVLIYPVAEPPCFVYFNFVLSLQWWSISLLNLFILCQDCFGSSGATALS